MRKIFTLILSVLFVSTLSAQQPEGLIMKASVAPVVDGVIDDVWEEANSYPVDKNYRLEVPTLGESTWKMLWTDDGFYVLLEVQDDEWYPSYMTGGNSWEYDKPEIYFDVNYDLADGVGAGAGAGHHQIADAPVEAKIDGTPTTNDDGTIWAFLVDNPTYIAEYFIPFSRLTNRDGGPIDIEAQIGFDVTLIDRDNGDEARKRAQWANVGAINENYSNMDDAGIITLDGAEVIPVDLVTLTGGDITAPGQTLQIQAEILPEDATSKVLIWTISTPEGSSGRASISNTGLVTPILNGVVEVSATSGDGFIYSNVVEVNISGQIPTMRDLSIVKNGYFDLADTTGAPTSWGNWVDALDGVPYGAAPTVVDGVVVLDCQLASADNWHYQFNQNNLKGLPDIPYLFSFKAWGSVDRIMTVDFEDTSGNNYNRYGVSSDPESNGRSEWSFGITTEPQWFNFHVTFDQIVPTTNQKVQYMISQEVGTVYLDSITVISEADMGLVPVLQNSIESFKVYPNPVANKLYVDLSSANTTVAIYNSVGIKMEETVVSGTHHMFDVSRYTKGLYFVKANNAVVKFIK